MTEHRFMDNREYRSEIKKTALWLLQVAGTLLVIIGAMISKDKATLYAGIGLWILFLAITAIQKHGKKGFWSYVFGILILILLLVLSLTKQP